MSIENAFQQLAKEFNDLRLAVNLVLDVYGRTSGASPPEGAEGDYHGSSKLEEVPNFGRSKLASAIWDILQRTTKPMTVREIELAVRRYHRNAIKTGSSTNAKNTIRTILREQMRPHVGAGVRTEGNGRTTKVYETTCCWEVHEEPEEVWS